MNVLAQTTTYDNSGAGVAAALAAATGSILIAVLVVTVIQIVVYYVILHRAGFNPWLALLVLIPGLGHLIIFVILVFTEWPVQRENRMMRAQIAGAGMVPPAGTAPSYTPQAGPYGTTLPPPGTPPAAT